MFHGIPHISMISSTREALKKKRLGIATSDLSLLGIIMGILGADDGSQMRTMVQWCWNMHTYMETPNIAQMTQM